MNIISQIDSNMKNRKLPTSTRYPSFADFVERAEGHFVKRGLGVATDCTEHGDSK